MLFVRDYKVTDLFKFIKEYTYLLPPLQLNIIFSWVSIILAVLAVRHKPFASQMFCTKNYSVLSLERLMQYSRIVCQFLLLQIWKIHVINIDRKSVLCFSQDFVLQNLCFVFKVTGEWASAMLWDDGIHPSLVSLIIINAFKEFR